MLGGEAPGAEGASNGFSRITSCSGKESRTGTDVDGNASETSTLVSRTGELPNVQKKFVEANLPTGGWTLLTACNSPTCEVETVLQHCMSTLVRTAKLSHEPIEGEGIRVGDDDDIARR